MEMDDQDRKMAIKLQAAFLNRPSLTPKTGDFLRYPDGSLKRITYVWDDENGTPKHIQDYHWRGGSFYISEREGRGSMSHSGSLDTGISADRLRATTETMLGSCWFFHHGIAGAGRGVYTFVECPIWDVI